MLAKRLSMKAKCVYIQLLNYAWQDGNCFPGQERLSQDLDVSIRTIQRALVELQDYGLIKWEQRGRTKTNIYYILPLDFLYEKQEKSEEKILPQSDMTVLSPHDTTELSYRDTTNLSPILYTEDNTQNKYKQTLTLSEGNVDNSTSLSEKNINNVNEKYKLENFDKEAVILAEELGDSKSIKYFQKIINKRDKGEIEDDDIQEALNQTRKAISESKGDGTNFLQNPSAWFVSILKKLIQKRDQKKRSAQLEEFKQKLLANKSI